MSADKGEQQHSIQGFFLDKRSTIVHSTVVVMAFSITAVLYREWMMALGIVIGLTTIYLNYEVMGVAIDQIFKPKKKADSPFLIVLAYFLRFWVLILFLHIMVTLWGAKFVIAALVGMSIIKITALYNVLKVYFSDEIYPPHVLPKKHKDFADVNALANHEGKLITNKLIKHQHIHKESCP